MVSLTKDFTKARLVSTPLIGITTLDPSAVISGLRSSIKDSNPQLQWDCVRGLCGLNKKGKEFVDQLANSGDQVPLEITSDPVFTLDISRELPPDSVLFFLNAHDHITEPRVRQGIWNLRDIYKRGGQTLVLLAPTLQLPPSLSQDIVIFDDPLPGDSRLKELILEQYTSAGVALPEEQFTKKCVEAVRGLAEFPTEQVVANSMSPEGVNLSKLWNYKRKVVEQTAGLSFNTSKETFDDIGGLSYFKTFMTRLFNGGAPPNAIIFIDEIEKLFAGAVHGVGDNTGVSQDQLGVLLSWMQDNEATGIICVGVSGSGKSHCAKAAANTFQVPCVRLDLGAIKGGIVGQSESRIREAMKVIGSIAGSNAFFIATCNKLESLPPELVRRFTQGILFFDLPSKEEREPIWKICVKNHNINPSQKIPNDDNWTGSEINNCCDLAYRLNYSLVEAAEHVRPLYVTHKNIIDRLRSTAAGTWNSASYKGPYQSPEQSGPPSSRKIRFSNDDFLEEKVHEK